MPDLLKTLRAAADPNRIRILLLLKAEELSVAELQEILTLGQSTISMHLQQLRQADVVEDRRAGKSVLYRLARESRGRCWRACWRKGKRRLRKRAPTGRRCGG